MPNFAVGKIGFVNALELGVIVVVIFTGLLFIRL